MVSSVVYSLKGVSVDSGGIAPVPLYGSYFVYKLLQFVQRPQFGYTKTEAGHYFCCRSSIGEIFQYVLYPKTLLYHLKVIA